MISAAPEPCLCRCGDLSTDHAPVVTADDRLVGRCLACRACSEFEAA